MPKVIYRYTCMQITRALKYLPSKQQNAALQFNLSDMITYMT